jgi:VWFA-related protein
VSDWISFAFSIPTERKWQSSVSRMRTRAHVLNRATMIPVVAGFCLLAGFSGTPQQPALSGDTVNRSGARQTLVQALVTDRDGRAVAGLKASDFDVLEDGAPQQVVSLTRRTDTGPPVTGGESPSSTALAVRQSYVVCVDALHSSFADSSRVRGALHKFFREEKGRGSLYELVVFGREPVVIQKVTTDPRAVMEALRGRQFQNAIRNDESTLMQVETGKAKRLLDGYCGKCPCGPAAPGSVVGACTARRAEIQAFVDGSKERTASQTKNFLGQLKAVVEDLSTVPRGRTLVLISDGFTLAPGRELYGILSAYLPNDPGWKFNPREAQHEVEPIFRRALALNVVIDTLDSRDADAAGDAGKSVDASSPGSFQHSRPAPIASKVPTSIEAPVTVRQSDTIVTPNAAAIEQLAKMTGGIFFQPGDNILENLKRAFANGREYYLIAYRPQNQAIDGGFRQIAVRVKNESWSVHAQAGYWAATTLPPAVQAARLPVEDGVSAGGEHTAREMPTLSADKTPPGKAGAGSAEPASAKGKKAIVGTVRQVSGLTVIVELADTRYMVLQVSGSTHFLNGSAGPVELRPGVDVRAAGKQANEHALLVDSIEVTSGSQFAPPAISRGPFETGNEPPPEPAPDVDETIGKARKAALRLVQALPNFICTQTVDRWAQRCGNCAAWAFQDVLSAEVLYSPKTGESYRDVRVKPSPRPCLARRLGWTGV